MIVSRRVAAEGGLGSLSEGAGKNLRFLTEGVINKFVTKLPQSACSADSPLKEGAKAFHQLLR